ncbi:MAG TPA: hypothetical protein VK087_06425 [Tissierellaceae bacterium]|nr:hypothetical protein [Tissierellaceae bacterium]
MDKEKNSNNNRQNRYLTLGIGLGLVFGSAIGSVFNNVSTGASFGMLIGIGIGGIMDKNRNNPKLNIIKMTILASIGVIIISLIPMLITYFGK